MTLRICTINIDSSLIYVGVSRGSGVVIHKMI